MCFDVLLNLLDLIYLVSILPEPPNFDDAILFKVGECNSPTFQTSNQDDTLEFYWIDFTDLIVK